MTESALPPIIAEANRFRAALLARDAADQAAARPPRPASVDDLPAATPAIGAAAAPQLLNSIAPWAFPAPVRELLLRPVHAAGVTPPIRCSEPLVDVSYLVAPAGVVIPLANWALVPIAALSLEVAVDRAVAKVVSVRHGELQPTVLPDGRLRIVLPLGSSDFVLLHYRP